MIKLIKENLKDYLVITFTLDGVEYQDILEVKKDTEDNLKDLIKFFNKGLKTYYKHYNMGYMEHWGKLTLHEKEVLIGKYGITAIGNPPEPLNANEYFKVPEEEWDRLIQKETPKRKGAPKKKAKKVVKEETLGVAKSKKKAVKKKKVAQPKKKRGRPKKK